MNGLVVWRERGTRAFLAALVEWVRASALQPPVSPAPRGHDVSPRAAQGTASPPGARGAASRPRAVIVDARVPTPDRDAGSVRMLAIVQLLQETGFDVALVPGDRRCEERYVAPLVARGVEVPRLPAGSSVASFLAERLPGVALVLLSRGDVAERYLEAARRHAPRARVVFDTVDLHYLREARQAQLRGDPVLRWVAAARKRQELGVARRSDVTLVVSAVEAEVLARDAPEVRVEVLSTIQEIRGRQAGFAERSGVLFIGSFRHLPNRDAMLWFVGEVMPHLRRLLPGARLTIVGSDLPPEIRALASLDVEVAGYVEDLAPLLDRCRLSVAPLRYGAGVKGKVNLSMSHGVPVVATPIAIEGMHLQDGSSVLVAEAADSFAAAVARLHEDPELWLRLSEGGLGNVAEHFSTEAARRALQRILGEVGPR